MQAANSGAFALCIFCLGKENLTKGSKPASLYAQQVDELLRQHAAVLLLITEAKVLNGRFGAFDFSVLLRSPSGSTGWRRLEIEIDGEQHFSKGMHGTSPQQQQAVDERKDKAAWAAGRCLLRLHCKDTRSWRAKINAAIDLATQPSPSKFLHYTSSYRKRNREAAI